MLELEKETKLFQKTFPLWPKHANNQITNEEDIKFLQSMKTDRIATFGSFDRIHKKTTEKKKNKKVQRQRKERSL